jgi:signal transduction histidine kinase
MGAAPTCIATPEFARSSYDGSGQTLEMAMDLDAPETLSMWSHEVRNPVASMVLSAHALRNRLRASGELAEIAERIVLAGNRAIVILESAMECGARTGRPDGLPVQPLPVLACLRDSLAVQAPYR